MKNKALNESVWIRTVSQIDAVPNESEWLQTMVIKKKKGRKKLYQINGESPKILTFVDRNVFVVFLSSNLQLCHLLMGGDKPSC